MCNVTKENIEFRYYFLCRNKILQIRFFFIRRSWISSDHDDVKSWSLPLQELSGMTNLLVDKYHKIRVYSVGKSTLTYSFDLTLVL